MDSGEVGFYLGALPGLTLVLRNMLLARRDVSAAESLARKHGELLDFNYSMQLKSDYLFRPRQFIGTDDGPGLRQAKERLLLVRRRTLVRHAAGGLVTMIGALLGTFISTGLWPDR